MSKTRITMTETELNNVLRSFAGASRHPDETNACIAIPRFAAPLTNSEKIHLSSCRLCQRRQDIFLREMASKAAREELGSGTVISVKVAVAAAGASVNITLEKRLAIEIEKASPGVVHSVRPISDLL